MKSSSVRKSTPKSRRASKQTARRPKDSTPAPEWLAKLVSAVGVREEWHDTDTPEVLVEMLAEAEMFYRRDAFGQRIRELGNACEAEWMREGYEPFAGIANVLLWLANHVDAGEELSVTLLAADHSNNRGGLALVFNGKMQEYRRKALNERREDERREKERREKERAALRAG